MLSDHWQQADGHVPCSEWKMDEECPPIFAYVVWQLYETTHDLDFLHAMYPRLQSQYDWWWKHNQVGDALFGGGDMGMENLPRGGGAQADSSAWMAFFARDMVRIATEAAATPPPPSATGPTAGASRPPSTTRCGTRSRASITTWTPAARSCPTCRIRVSFR